MVISYYCYQQQIAISFRNTQYDKNLQTQKAIKSSFKQQFSTVFAFI